MQPLTLYGLSSLLSDNMVPTSPRDSAQLVSVTPGFIMTLSPIVKRRPG